MRVISGRAGGLHLKIPKTDLRPTMDVVKGAIYSSLGDFVNAWGIAVEWADHENHIEKSLRVADPRDRSRPFAEAAYGSCPLRARIQIPVHDVVVDEGLKAFRDQAGQKPATRADYASLVALKCSCTGSGSERRHGDLTRRRRARIPGRPHLQLHDDIPDGVARDSPFLGVLRVLCRGEVDGEGRFSITHTFRIPGSTTVRILARAHGITSGASEPLTYTIERQQRSGVSTQASALTSP